MKEPKLSYEQWRAYGQRQGWVGPGICYTHDGLPLSADEEDEFETGDPCIYIMRIYNDIEHKLAVEVEHSPSQWRV